MRLHFFWPLVLVVSVQIIEPSHAFLLDSGASTESDSSGTDRAGAQKDVYSHLVAANVHSESLVVPDASQVGLSHGCRRSTDFFEQVCNSQSAASVDAGTQAASIPLAPVVTADLLVCDLPEIEPLIRSGSDRKTPDKAPSATYAVSGTIVVHGSADTDAKSQGGGLPELSEGPTFDAGPSHASYPGPDDEGFWRQRDGKHEWHPASNTVVKASTKASDTSIGDIQDLPDGESRATIRQDGSHLSDYDAWSAEQEQGAFLSFNEWKERHAQDSHGQIHAAHATTPRREVRDSTARVRSPSPESTTTPRRVEVDSQDSQHHTASHVHRNTASQTSDFSDAHTPHRQPPSTATALGQTGSPQTAEPSVHAPESISADASEPRIQKPPDAAQVGLSVAAGDTSAQLSKLKHRWNFASLDCAAVVHRTNQEAKFASSILSEKKDRYMLSPCPHRDGKLKGGSQFVIVELCEEIKIDTIVLANYEFFSNMFKKFTVTAARQLTGRENDWTQLGVFRARNVRGQQVFRIPFAPRSEAFFRYVRIDFLEHFGSEFYCPVSLLRVYGITEMEEYKREFEGSGERDSIAELTEATQTFVEDIQQSYPDPVDAVPSQEPVYPQTHQNADSANLTAKDEDIWRKHEQAFQRKLQNQSLTHDAADVETHDSNLPQRDHLPTQASSQTERISQTSSPHPRSPDGDVAADYVDFERCAIEDAPTASEKDGRCPRPRDPLKPFYYLASGSKRSHSKQVKQHSQASQVTSAARSNALTNAAPGNHRLANGATDVEADIDRARRASMHRQSGTPPTQQGNPGSESVYRAIHRRLNALESNATLSHSYIEHSGQMLREVFARMEKRQENRMSDMLRALNASNWQQIESLKRRQHVDLQRAIFEFDVHRQQADTERRALLREVHILAEEVLLEKRLSIAQLILLLVVFVFVGLTRGSRTVPLLHSGFAKIGRSSKRRDVKAESKLVLPASPRKDVVRMEQSMDFKQPQSSPLKDNMQGQARKEARNDSSAGHDSNLQRPRHSAEFGTPVSKLRSSPLAPGMPPTAVSPRASMQYSRSSVKIPVASLAGRSGFRGESLIGMLSHPRTRGRLIMLLETLDALDRGADRRRLSKTYTPRSMLVRHHKSGDQDITTIPALRLGHDLVASPSSELARRTSRSQRPMLTYKQDQTHVNGRRHATPGRDRKVAHSGFDELAGMSSDWTERSENGEVSENPAYLTEDEERGIRATGSDLFSLEPALKSKPNVPLDRLDVPKIHSSSFARDHSPTPAWTNTAADSLRPSEPENRLASTPQHDDRILTTAHDLPSIVRADGRLSSSDSESEGGAWHRVLPRRVGNGSNIRRARQGTIDGKSYKLDTASKPVIRTEAPDRRGSPRPSSAPGSGFKSQKAGLSRLFRANTPDYISPESPQNRRSGTPDTIRDVKPA
ncbi:uncharacterized protein UTRI_05506_B [Ustilago trichophora]|uniref:SUN domain-containing protein n=1 Tax=Ustilago trichophora TaxID=86804 RepID=A0A5C3EL92_9BASI|nr:uncharacterized protein UTRI_05506_B [Ustilago trichophora]